MIARNSSFLIILSAPSGGGKSTLVNEVLKVAKNIEYSVSYTTRSPRGKEENGVHYHFVSEAEFLKRIDEGDFLEHARVFGNWYGTSKSFIKSRLAKNHHVILDIDVQGASLISATDIPYVKIFILPPSMQVLKKRLMLRATDSEEEIAKRIQIAKEEVTHIPKYDYLVINDELEKAVQDVLAIIRAEENRVCRYSHPCEDFINIGENQ
ncbi:MAG TPA: guanylate kinase [Candidatus Cloacimonas sp.]|nr:guanylate kinase [Candidatus Cloacimonas sp.]MDD2251055.1 guanylate kinase [Candidatus Cloacimonadota bacterium]MCK9158330.1 guanylate kinase [Candidatus Cloacimonas sp.]MCK9165591.1 guanylate kinase [Candidatus Cloacimonas sp.]MDD3733490.1 guanylate kinase [Candidatus Cloacimonadota bacterium]